MWLTSRDLNKIEDIVRKYAIVLKGQIVTSAQNTVDAITTELTALSTPLATLLTEVEALVSANPTVDTTALQAAADAVVNQVNAVSDAAGTPPVVTPPAS